MTKETKISGACDGDLDCGDIRLSWRRRGNRRIIQQPVAISYDKIRYMIPRQRLHQRAALPTNPRALVFGLRNILVGPSARCIVPGSDNCTCDSRPAQKKLGQDYEPYLGQPVAPHRTDNHIECLVDTRAELRGRLNVKAAQLFCKRTSS